MINMVFFAHFATAVIALAALCLVLALNISGGVTAWGLQLKRATAIFVGASHLWVCLAVGAVEFGLSFLIGYSPRTGFLKMFFLVGRITLATNGPQSFSVKHLIRFFVFDNFISIGRTIGASQREPMRPVGHIIGFGLFEHPLSVGKVIGSFAGFAVAIEAAFRSSIARKMLYRRRLPLFALGAIFGWDRLWGILSLHQKLTFLVSSQGRSRGVAWHFLLGSTPVIIPQAGGVA